MIWAEKYRPVRLQDIIIPKRLTDIFNGFLEKDFIPNLMLSGGPGVGKTTTAIALLKELDLEYIIINGSLDRNIDTIRNDIISFASSVSFNGKRRYVVIDEADNLNAESSQLALRGVIEEYASNCGFIFTGNFKHNLCGPLLSRLSSIDFNFTKEERAELCSRFMKRAIQILELEGVQYDKQALGMLIMQLSPDWRQILIELQKYGMSSGINAGVLVNIMGLPLKPLVKALKEKDFESLRAWVAENSGYTPKQIFRGIYNKADAFMDGASLAQLILLIGKYQYQSAFVADQEINIVAFLTEVMVSCEIKA